MSKEQPKGPNHTPPLPIGTRVTIADEIGGTVIAVRRRKKFPRRYLIAAAPDAVAWFRRDELAVIS